MCTLTWKTMASLNELHPSLLSVLSVWFIWSLLQQILFCSSTSCLSLFPSWTNIPVIPAVPPGQAQEHKLSVPCSPADTAGCRIIMTHWTYSPVQVRLMELPAPSSCRYQHCSGIPNRQPHTKIQCLNFVPPAAGTQASTQTSTQYGELLIEEHSQKCSQMKKQDRLCWSSAGHYWTYVLTGLFYLLFHLFSCTCFSLDLSSLFLSLSLFPALNTLFKALYGHPHKMTAKWKPIGSIYSEGKINVTQVDFFLPVYQNIITGDMCRSKRAKVFYTAVSDLKSLQTLSRDQMLL